MLPKIASVDEKKDPIGKGIPTKTKHILYVENDMFVANAVEGMLKALGYQATLATGGTEAIELLQKDPALFDIVITDKNLGRLNGLDLSVELKKIKPDINIILCTGENFIDHNEIKEATGISEILFKPFGINDLKNIIEKMN